MAAMAPMSLPDQLPWLLGMIPLSLKVAVHKSPSLTLGIQRVTKVISLPNIETLAVGAVCYLSSPGPAMECSPRPAKQHQHHTTAPTSQSSSSSIPPGPAEGNSDSKDDVDVEHSGSMENWDRDFVMVVSEDEAIHEDNESDSDSDSRESVTNSAPESAMGDDCLTCLDTKKTAVKSSHKRFHKKVQASCSPSKQGVWKDTQLEQIRNNHNTVGGVTTGPSKQNGISFWIGTLAHLKCKRWQSTLTSCFRSRQPLR